MALRDARRARMAGDSVRCHNLVQRARMHLNGYRNVVREIRRLSGQTVGEAIREEEAEEERMAHSQFGVGA